MYSPSLPLSLLPRLLLCWCVCVSDTEGGFVVERAVDIANAAVQHIRTVSKTSDEEG